MVMPQCPQALLDALQHPTPAPNNQAGAKPILPASKLPASGLDPIARFQLYLEEMGVCHPEPDHPQDASTHLFKAACAGAVGFDLGEEAAVALLLEWDRGNAVKPYPGAEIRRQVRNALERCDKPKGYLLMDTQPGSNGHYSNGQAGGQAPGSPSAHPAPRRRVVRRTMSQIQVKALRWLFKNRIPLGKVTVLDGDPDLGKSTLMLDLAARTTGAGSNLAPDGTPIECGVADVLIMSGEDDPEDTIRPRLELAGADLDRVHFLDHVETDTGPEPLIIPRDLDLIEEEIKRTGAKLLVIDPLMSFLDDKCDSNKDQSVRKALTALSQLARRTGCTIVLQRHLNKNSNAKAIYRGGGSIAISAHARSALLVAVDPDDDAKRLLAVVKKNRWGDAPTLRFLLDPVSVELAGEPDTICRIGWCGTSPYKADDLVQAPKMAKSDDDKTATAKEEAETFLKEFLGHGQPVRYNTVSKKAHKLGIGLASLKRAKKSLGVKSAPIREAGKVIDWTWYLPGACAPGASGASGEEKPGISPFSAHSPEDQPQDQEAPEDQQD